jgi:hypothetical protein
MSGNLFQTLHKRNLTMNAVGLQKESIELVANLWMSGNLFQTLHKRNRTMNAVGLQKESIELVASLIYQPSRFASTARRAPLQIFAARSFYTVCHRNVRLRSSLKNWTMNF